jgi:hypothetical protein
MVAALSQATQSIEMMAKEALQLGQKLTMQWTLMFAISPLSLT